MADFVEGIVIHQIFINDYIPAVVRCAGATILLVKHLLSARFGSGVPERPDSSKGADKEDSIDSALSLFFPHTPNYL
jgi:hypothetical protein